jgi:hypothetical protein
LPAGSPVRPSLERGPWLRWCNCTLKPESGPRRRSGRPDMSALNLPKPAWRTEEHDMLAESARAFLAKEFVPNLDRWSEDGRDGPRRLDQGGGCGPALRLDPRGIWRGRRRLQPRGDHRSRDRHGGRRFLGLGHPRSHRRALHPPLRHGRAEAELAAEDGDRRTDRGPRHDRARARARTCRASAPGPSAPATAGC